MSLPLSRVHWTKYLPTLKSCKALLISKPTQDKSSDKLEADLNFGFYKGLGLYMLLSEIFKRGCRIVCLKQKECTNVWDIEGSLSKCS